MNLNSLNHTLQEILYQLKAIKEGKLSIPNNIFRKKKVPEIKVGDDLEKKIDHQLNIFSKLLKK